MIATGSAFVIATVCLSLSDRWFWRSNFGFGSDWHCTYPGKGGPVCIKDPQRPIAK